MREPWDSEPVTDSGSNNVNLPLYVQGPRMQMDGTIVIYYDAEWNGGNSYFTPSSPGTGDTQIPLVRTSSKLVVKRTPEGRSQSRAFTSRFCVGPASWPASPTASAQGPMYPALGANSFHEVTDLFC
ncbi:hypothetical protein K440DRAFT_657792 [Wilcoxina mikolae CBS 423.85]|nr:hypothetical protein K440DRAFT_657792 [Wilcoxina mikolae CBS 423.85]